MTRAPETGILPRWEWRSFAHQFMAAERQLADITPDSVQETVDLHLVSRGGEHTVKVRDGLMDVKHLESVDDDGLERWRPVMKASFPLSADKVDHVLADLHLSAGRRRRARYTLDELLKELLDPTGEAAAIEVRKRRAHFTLRGCMVELTEVRTDRGTTRTIAVESDDPTLVIATVRELGLGSLPNLSYTRWLKMLVGLMPAHFAVIDVGTNSVKFHIAERDPDGQWRTVVDRAEVTRLGEGLDQTGRLQPAPMARTLAAIAAMIEEAQRCGALGIVAVGTAGLRIASNGAAFVDAVAARCGVRVEVISGEDEGRLAYLATTRSLGLAEGSLVVFDSGGGSSQFTFGRGDRVDERFSVNVGAARFTERFGLDGPVSDGVLADALAAIATDLARLDGRPPPDVLVGMGGAMTNLAAVTHGLTTYDPEIVQGTVLDRAEIDRQIERYRTATVEDRRRIVGLQPQRAELILAGACIVRTVMAKLRTDAVIVSDRGLRHGLLLERFALPGTDVRERHT